MAYLLDANVFIQGRKLHFGFDICPGFWDWVAQRAGTGDVRSVAEVGRELTPGNDELATWATARGDEFFLPTDASVLPSLREVSTWVTGQNYAANAITTFLSVADYYLVARAHASQDIVVTHEVPGRGPGKVKIPDVCIGLGVRYMNPFEMLRAERVRLVLG